MESIRRGPLHARRNERQQVLPRHTSEQRHAPELHEELNDRLNAEAGPPDKGPLFPNPRYEIKRTSPNPNTKAFLFTIHYQADTPSAALAFAHHVADRLDIPLEWQDKHTGRNLVITALSETDL